MEIRLRLWDCTETALGIPSFRLSTRKLHINDKAGDEGGLPHA